MNPARNARHIPVLASEVQALLHVQPGDTIVDATLDGGGHTELLLTSVAPNGRVLGIEQDPDMVGFMNERIKHESGVWKNLIVHHGNFRDIAAIVASHNIHSITGVLFDLGVSRWHFIESGRGFSFQNPDEPLSMALAKNNAMSAARILNSSPETELENIIRVYGEERRAQQIAKAIVMFRRKKRLVAVEDLLLSLEPVLGTKRKGKMHPATKTFQAFRIAVNDELGALREGLAGTGKILRSGGRLVVISYHSLEDRIVKQIFRTWSAQKMGNLLNKKPITPSREEIFNNPSARSAKLRAIQKL
ncbi:MAG TPA: 16S rRNA (cytosine(1402)-N(4))-methyltransferase RsmH [Candidatus Paceibacterota bacterium]